MRVERGVKITTRAVLLALATAVAAMISTMAAGPATAQSSGEDQYCLFGAAQPDPDRGCDEVEIIILPLPEPVDQVPDQPKLVVDVPGENVAVVRVSGIVRLVGDGSEIAVQPGAVNFVNEKAVSAEAAPASASPMGAADYTGMESAPAEPLPGTGGPDVSLSALLVSGALAMVFGGFLFRRTLSGR